MKYTHIAAISIIFLLSLATGAEIIAPRSILSTTTPYTIDGDIGTMPLQAHWGCVG